MSLRLTTIISSAFAFYLKSLGPLAASDCSSIERLQESADAGFSDIRGDLVDPLLGYYAAKYSMRGGKCQIEEEKSYHYVEYQCRWYVAQSHTEAKTAYDKLVSSTQACLSGASATFRTNQSGGETADIRVAQDRRVGILYGYWDHWWFVEFSYELRKE